MVVVVEVWFGGMVVEMVVVEEVIFGGIIVVEVEEVV